MNFFITDALCQGVNFQTIRFILVQCQRSVLLGIIIHLLENIYLVYKMLLLNVIYSVLSIFANQLYADRSAVSKSVHLYCLTTDTFGKMLGKR